MHAARENSATAEHGPQPIGEDDFELMVREALRGAGGALLFSMTVGPRDARSHVAAASVGSGAARRLLIITMPEAGGELVTETAADSAAPIARIAESYAGLADVLARAA
jgi:hypothetical protein